MQQSNWRWCAEGRQPSGIETHGNGKSLSVHPSLHSSSSYSVGLGVVALILLASISIPVEFAMT